MCLLDFASFAYSLKQTFTAFFLLFSPWWAREAELWWKSNFREIISPRFVAMAWDEDKHMRMKNVFWSRLMTSMAFDVIDCAKELDVSVKWPPFSVSSRILRRHENSVQARRHFFVMRNPSTALAEGFAERGKKREREIECKHQRSPNALSGGLSMNVSLRRSRQTSEED